MKKTTKTATQIAEDEMPVVQAPEEELSPEEMARPLWAAKGFVGEDEQSRDAHTRCFLGGDGVRHVEISNAPLNYFDETEAAWKPLDGTVTEDENEYMARFGTYAARVKKGTEGNGVTLTQDGVSLSWELVDNDASVMQNEMHTGAHPLCPVCAAHRMETVSGGTESRIVYENVAESTDLAYCIHGDHVKEDIIVRERGAANAYSFLMHTQGLVACLNEDNTIFLFREDSDNMNAPALIIPAPYMTDADGVRSDSVTYALTEQSDGEYLLTVTADEAWMNAPERAYPVTIDPQVVLPENDTLFSIRNMRLYALETEPYDNTHNRLNGRLYLGCTSEYLDSGILTIHKELIELSDSHLFNVVLRLYYKENTDCDYVTVVFPNGSVKDFHRIYSNPYIDITLTDAYLDAVDAFSIEIYPGNKSSDNHCVFDVFSANTILEFDYFPDDFTPMIEKEYSVNQNVTAILNITTGEKTTVIEDVPAADSVMGIPVSHVFKTGCGEPGLGRHFRLNVQERLYAPHDELYVYSDERGNCHGFREHYYYVDDSGQKRYVSKNSVMIDPDSSLHTEDGKTVTREYRSDTGWKLIAQQTGVPGLRFVEQRSEDQKNLEEQLKAYHDVLSEHVVFNTQSGEIVNDNGMLTEEQIFAEYAEYVNAGLLLMSRSEAMQYKLLKEQHDRLDNPESCSSNVVPGMSLYPYNVTYEKSIYDCEQFLIPFVTKIVDENVRSRILACFAEKNNDLMRLVEPGDFEGAFLRNEQYSSNDPDMTVLGADIRSRFRDRNMYIELLIETDRQRDNQMADIEAQMEEIQRKKHATQESLKQYYQKYCQMQEQLREIKQQTPVTYLTDGDIIRGFNEDGRLIIVYNQYEQYAYFEYDTKQDYRLLSIVDSEGNAVRFHYTPSGDLDAITNVRGERITYRYIGGELERVSYPDGSDFYIRYDSSGQILLMTDSNKLQTTYWPQSDVRNQEISCVSWTHPPETLNDWEKMRRRVLFVKTVNTDEEDGCRTVTVKHPLSATNEEYHFDAINQLVAYYVEQNDVVVSAERYEYRWNEPEPYLLDKKTVFAKPETLRLCSLTDFRFEDGDWTSEAYDRFGNISSQESSPVKLDEDGNVTSTTTSTYLYDESQNLIREEKHVTVVSNTVEESVADDETGEVTQTTVTETLDDYIAVVVYEYDAKGRNICTRSFIEGQQDTAGVVVKETVYNEKGGLVETTTYNSLDPSSKFRERQDLNDDGQVVGIWDETGLYKTVYEYRADRPAVRHVISPNGAKQAYESDDYSHVEVRSCATEEGEENSTRKKYTYGMLTELQSGNNEIHYTYDMRRRLEEVMINSESPVVSIRYIENSLYNGKSVDDCRTTMANGHEIGVFTRKGDDAVLRVTSTMDGKTYITKYNRDSLDRLTDRTVTQSGSGSVIEKDEYSYDSLNRVTAFAHTLNGDRDETEQYIYNSRGELCHKELSAFGQDIVIDYTRDDTPARNLTSVSVNGFTVFPETDSLGRSIGKHIEREGAEIAREKITYRKEGDCATAMPSTVSFGKDGFLSYTYDEMGNIKTIHENGRLIARYTYDRIGRLCREDDAKTNKTTTCVYDNNGNILFRFLYPFTLDKTEYLAAETPLESHIYSYDGDRMLSYDGETCTYDVMGCPTVYRGHSMTWGEYCRPLSYTLTNEDTVTYTYDVGGRRIGKNDLRFVYSSDGALLAQSNGITFLYDTTGSAGFTFGEETYLYRKNAQGDVIALLNTEGQVVATYVYDAWGNHRVFDAEGIDITNGSQYNNHVGNLNPIRYRSYYFDIETGLYLVSSRYYDPETGRFISPDDISNLDPDTINGLNLYAYCLNNPIYYFDPNGHWAMPNWLKWVIGGVVIVGLGIATALSGGAAGVILGAAFYGAVTGAVSGALVNGLLGGVSSAISGNGFWCGFADGAADGFMFGAIIGGATGALTSGINIATGGVKIVGTAQKTGSVFHQFASNVQAGKMSMALGRYSEIHLNRSKGLGIKGFRPDVTGITKNGLRVVEVVSSTQTYANQVVKVTTMMGRYSHITNGLVLDGLHLLLRWFVF